MKEPLVSIIVPVCNVEDYIEKSATSILSQTYPNIEFIFIDDGSLDRSSELLDNLIENKFSHLKSRIKIVHQENRGVQKVRIEAMQYAHGDYFIQLDSDDRCRKTMIEKMVKKAVEDDADIVICNYFNTYPEFIIPRREKRFPTKTATLSALFSGRSFRGCLWNKFIKRSIFTDNPICAPSYDMGEDLVLSAQFIWYSERISYIKNRLYFYTRRNPQSLSSKTRIDRDETNISNKMDLYRYCKKEGIGLFDGFEQSFLAYMAYLILKGRCTHLFNKYPETAETAKKISLPSAEIDMSEKKQREYKQLLTEYSFA